ncbi:MAG TPA: FHA domain-containing protein, partial [Ktedonobacteraceae bacterium]|nr:FHA domain-containing protein [Ktedonobacteraceae bacterium]
MSSLDKPQASASIRFLTGPLAGITFPITRPVTTVGRDQRNDIVIADHKVSRLHARLVSNNGLWSIEKLTQTSFISVDGRHIEQAVLTHNSRIDLGEDSSFLFLLPVADTQLEETVLWPKSSLATNPPVTSSSNPATLPIPDSLPASTLLPPQPVKGTESFLAGSQETVLFPEKEQDPSLSPSLLEQPLRPHGTEIASLSALGFPVLLITNNTTGTQKEYALVKQVIDIGRDASNDIVINDPCLSAFHLQLVRQGSQWILLHPHPDRNKTMNGLYHQGHKISGDESFRKSLFGGDVFRIGNEHDTLFTLSFHEGGGDQQKALPHIEPIKLTQDEITIGRLPDNTLVLPHPQVSVHHARMVRENGSYRIHDIGSTNHLYVNSQPVTNHLLKLGDDIRIGPYRLMYESTRLLQYDESKDIRIDALNLKKVGNNDITLLNNISLSIPPRSFVAIVGGSGAGKSMLMDALNGLRPADQGTVLYNGQDYYCNLAAFSSQIGYVPQDDIVHRDLTVERALYYAAKMRLPADFTAEQIQQRISEV